MKNNLSKLVWLMLPVIFFSCQKSEVEVSLPKILNSNMVLQRDADLKIWGWGTGEGKVTVTINDQKSKSSLDENGNWMVSLDPMEAGGPYEMKIMGIDTITLDNILIGDVWVCSGQSNMEWPLSLANDSEAEIAAANHPQIRLFYLPKNLQLLPVDTIPSGEWTLCSPETAAGFSAVAYFFGREIQQETGIAIGLINSNWGGTNVETWISADMCEEDAEMLKMIEGIAGMDLEELKKKKEEEMKQLRESLGALELGIVDGEPIWAAEDLDISDWKTMEVPGFWEENGMDGLDGVVWYRRTFTLTEAQAKKPALVKLGAIDDSDHTWLNGKLIGETYNLYSEERSYQVDQGVLIAGENHIVVRIEDTGGGGGFWSEADGMLVKTFDSSVPLAGDWNYRVSAADLAINPVESIGPNEMPTLLYNGMIHPILNYAIQGAIWYQGESNAQNAFKYRTRFPNMIKDWRNKWNNQDMGFYFVQLANFMPANPEPAGSTWAELREAQTMTLDLPKTGMAVTIDIGEADDIHPRNKQDVGYRLALAALHDTYGQELVYSGPVYKAMSLEGSAVTVEFDHVGGGLHAKGEDGMVHGFALAGDDLQYYWAEGTIVDNTVVLTSAEVEHPVSVRYAWADNPDTANLYNKEGLPAGPFRTDTSKGVTE